MRRIVCFLFMIPFFTACSGPLDISGDFLSAINDASRSRVAAAQELKSVFSSPGAKALADFNERQSTFEQFTITEDVAASVAGASQDLAEVRIMYETARGDWNGLLDTGIFIIQTHHNISDWKEIQKALATARTDTAALRDRSTVALRRLDNVQIVLAKLPKSKGLTNLLGEISPEEKKALEATQSAITQYIPIVGPILNALLAAQLQQNADDRARAIALLTSLKWESSDCVLGEKTCPTLPSKTAAGTSGS